MRAVATPRRGVTAQRGGIVVVEGVGRLSRNEPFRGFCAFHQPVEEAHLGVWLTPRDPLSIFPMLVRGMDTYKLVASYSSG